MADKRNIGTGRPFMQLDHLKADLFPIAKVVGKSAVYAE